MQVNNILHSFDPSTRLAAEAVVGVLWLLFIADYMLFLRRNNTISTHRECLEAIRRHGLRD